MGGEFGSAVIYVSELASPKRRGLFVALLQLSAHTGMILATLLVMLLENTISDGAGCCSARSVRFDTQPPWVALRPGSSLAACRDVQGVKRLVRGTAKPASQPVQPQHDPFCRPAPSEAMHVWGWRIPFLCAFAAAMLGAFLRRGMPEPHAFLAAARAEKERQQQRRELAADSGADMEVEIVSPRAEKVGGNRRAATYRLAFHVSWRATWQQLAAMGTRDQRAPSVHAAAPHGASTRALATPPMWDSPRCRASSPRRA